MPTLRSAKRIKVESANGTAGTAGPASRAMTPPSSTSATGIKEETKSPGKASPAKLKFLEQYGFSPFPSHKAPTHEQAHRVLKSLAAAHGGAPERPSVPPPSTAWRAGCGEVPSVLDALVRTILSQNTSDRNSSAAKRSLDAVFSFDPDEKYRLIHEAEESKVAEALKCGGLANIKAKRIKKILETIADKQGGSLDLDHLHEMSDREVMEELLSFDGVGPKTASCVLLFCLKRSSFAVDTHVFRLTKALGWIPQKATREQAHMHLDARIPEDVKYPLHVLLIREGKRCPNCAANGRPGGRKGQKGGVCGLRDNLEMDPEQVELDEKAEVELKIEESQDMNGTAINGYKREHQEDMHGQFI